MKPAIGPARLSRRFAAVAALILLGLISAWADLQLLSVPTATTVSSASAGGDSYMPIVSADGRYVLFASTANNLTPDSSNVISLSPTPLKMNLYRRDRSNATTTLVSVNLAGTGANDDCTPIALSTNGQFALFESSASDLIAGDTNGLSDVFVRDIEAGNTVLVSVSTNGFVGNNASADSAMTPDGRFVAFASRAYNLISADTNATMRDVFVRDLVSGTTTLASVGAWGNLFFASSDSPGITPDGRYVVFHSTATNMVPGIVTTDEIYVRDLVANNTSIISTNARAYFSGPPLNPLYSENHVISTNGEFVAFETYRYSPPFSNLLFRANLQNGQFVLVATNGALGQGHALDMTADGRYVAFIGKPDPAVSSTTCVFVWDGESATARIISTNLSGAVPTNSECSHAAFDATGQVLSFLSTATNLTTNVVSSEPHLYLHELATGVAKLVDVTINGTGSTGTLWGAQSLNSGGRFVAFDSDSLGLVSNDDNQSTDVFLRDLATESTELISIRSANFASETAGYGYNNQRPSMSADGRYAAFATSEGFSPSSTNRRTAVFARDLLNQTNILVSADTNALVNGNGGSFQPIISGNGRYVAFASFANNLVPGDANKNSDVFIRDLATGVTSLVSTNRFGTGSGDGPSRLPFISHDGRFVLFYSKAANLSSGGFAFDTENVYLRDRALGTNYALTMGGASTASMTPDGRFVAFNGALASSSTPMVYVWDSLAARRVYTNTGLSASGASISPSGRFLAYYDGNLRVVDRIANTNVSTVLPIGLRLGFKFSNDERTVIYSTRVAKMNPDTNGVEDVFIFDLRTAANTLISRSTNLVSAANGRSISPDISADGRFIVFASDATDLAPSDSNRSRDVFLHDRQNGTTTLLSVSSYAARSANRTSSAPVFSGDGSTVMFQTFASDLAEHDFNQGMESLFLRLPSANPVFAGQIVYSPASGQPPTIAWIAPPGKSYAVEFKNELTDATWQPLNANVSIANNIGNVVDPNPSPNHRFYRVVAN